jgi:hypothetical protein
MKIVEVLTIASLFLLPGAIVPIYAQGEREPQKQPEQKQQQAKPAQQPQRAQQQAKPAQQPQRAQQQAKPAQQPQRAQQQAKPAQQPQRAQQQAKPAQQPQRAQQQAKPAQQPQRAQQQAKPAQQPQRAQKQAGTAQHSADRVQTAEGHGRIPDAQFRASFGRGHTFHVSRSDFAGGSRRFQYGGFWFAMVNPWPVGWLYTDSVYVDYMNGGYFLCDPFHPGVYLSITVG